MTTVIGIIAGVLGILVLAMSLVLLVMTRIVNGMADDEGQE
jgi:hypothetical protein